MTAKLNDIEKTLYCDIVVFLDHYCNNTKKE